ncbi:rCG63319 [Rattus norvegicus]|uniref:RCG63319 n=1 Tax=Rattus norvegicus TaxID=10116 RepID=A6KBE6_RAT|nr:rCG63319 [Rattus norvegicus]
MMQRLPFIQTMALHSSLSSCS